MNLETQSSTGHTSNYSFSGGITGSLVLKEDGTSKGHEVHIKTPMGRTYVVKIHGATARAIQKIQSLYGNRTPHFTGELTILAIGKDSVINSPRVRFTITGKTITIQTCAVATTRLKTTFQTAS